MNGVYGLKPLFVRRLRRIEDLLVAKRISPDAITIAAVGVSVAVAVVIALGGILDRPLLWICVPPLVLARLALNALDGAVARKTNRTGPFGAVLNETCDRVSDGVILGALGFVISAAVAMAACASAFLVSHAGLLAQMSTGARATTGPMGKADRLAVLSVAALVAAGSSSTAPWEFAAWIVIVGGLVTAAVRVVSIGRRLKAHHAAVG